jgi:hypothetical protein
MNLYIEQTPCGMEADGVSPLFKQRIIYNGRDVVPTDEQRERVLGLIASLEPPAKEAPKEEPKAPAKSASKHSDK